MFGTVGAMYRDTTGAIDGHAAFSLDEAAAILRCPPSWLEAQRAAGAVPHHRTGAVRGTYFTVADLCAIIDSHACPPAGADPAPHGPAAALPVIYTRAEAAARLGMSETGLRDAVTAGRVAHHRRGRRKGVYFTDADLDAIRAAQHRPAVCPPIVAPPTVVPAEAPAPAGSQPVIPDRFTSLRHRRRSAVG